jgi:hypothetical protein
MANRNATPPAAPGEETAAEALDRARSHARRAIGEAFAALRALIDAASLGWSGRPSEAHAALRGISQLLEEQAQRFQDGEAGVPAAVMNAIVGALDQEIARWEKRASLDPDARAVLRTFLGLREILWEFGLRRDDTSPMKKSAKEGPEEKASPAKKRAPRKRSTSPRAGTAPPKRRTRVQRVDVQS